MTTFFTDADLVGAGQFSDPELALATEFTIGTAGTATFRWRFPNNAPSVTPTIRVWNDANVLVAGPISFDSADLASWNTAGAGSPVALAAGTYRVAVNTTTYTARTGFFTNPITRGYITGVQGRFGSSPNSAPGGTSTATYFVDIDFTPDGGPGPDPEPEDPGEQVLEEPRLGSAMHMARVMEEVALVLGRLPGLTRFHDWPPPTLTPPAGYVSYPEQIQFNQAYQRGEDDYVNLPIVLVAGPATEKRSRNRVAEWTSSDGHASVQATLEAHTWESCDDLTLQTAEFDVESIAGVEYLTVVFKALVVGPGRE